MQFEKKKTILTYLGKDGKDVRALERFIRQGKVVYDGTYYSVKVDGVEDRNKMEKLEDIENFLYNRESDTSKVDKSALEEAQINAKYYEDLYNKEVAENQQMIRNMYRYVTQKLKLRVEWEQFRDFAVNGEEGSQ